MRKIKTAFNILFFLLALSVPAYGQSIQIVTEQYPPYSFKGNNEIKGVATEVVRAVLNEVKLKGDFKIYPWARAYKMALKEKDILIYCISRFPKREKLFKWVGVISPIDFYIFALKDRDDINIVDLEDAKKYQAGTIREDALEQYLINQGFENIQRNNSNEANMKKLLSGRIDLWPISEMAAYHYLSAYDYAPADTIKRVYHFKGFSSSDQYMAFSKSTSDELVNTLKEGLKRIKENGTYQVIIDKYMK